MLVKCHSRFFAIRFGQRRVRVGGGDPEGHARPIVPFSLGSGAPSYPLFYRPDGGLDAVWIPARLHHQVLLDGIVFRR